MLGKLSGYAAASSQVTDQHRLHKADQLTDVGIICRGRTWRAHRLVLALKFQVLLRLCDNNPVESRVLDLSAHNPKVVDKLVEFLYKRNCTVLIADPPTASTSISVESAEILLGMSKIAKE